MERHYAIYLGKNLAFFFTPKSNIKVAFVFKGKERAEKYAAEMTKKRSKKYHVELVRVSTYRKVR